MSRRDADNHAKTFKWVPTYVRCRKVATMTTQTKTETSEAAKVKPKIDPDDHTKYWPCKYHTMGCECVIDASVFCPKVACVWKCILTGNQTVFELAKGADE